MAKAETKSELNEIIENLERRIAYYGKERERHDREKAHLSSLFIELYEEKRTLDLRFSWLEEAATNVVNSCPEHLPQQIVELADDLGIELKQEK